MKEIPIGSLVFDVAIQEYGIIVGPLVTKNIHLRSSYKKYDGEKLKTQLVKWSYGTDTFPMDMLAVAEGLVEVISET